MNDLADIKGVGAATLEKFAALGINCVRDLLLFLPSSYTDLGAPVPLRDAEDGEFALLEGEVLSVTEPQKRGKKSFTLRLRDTLDPKGMFFTVTYFNQPYYRAQFETGKVYRFFGKIKSGSPALVNPVFDRADGDKLQGIYTTYPLKGLIGRNAFVKIMREALHTFPRFVRSCRQIHFSACGVGPCRGFLHLQESVVKVRRPTQKKIYRLARDCRRGFYGASRHHSDGIATGGVRGHIRRYQRLA